MKQVDNRVRFTKAMLHAAILKILETKPIDKITIKEICETAEINRGTFYLHYSTPHDLLKEIENEFIENHLAFFSPYMREGHEMSHLESMFGCILKNGDICKILMGRNGDPQMLESLRIMVKDSVVDDWQKEFPDYDRENLAYVFDFVFSGAMTLILRWIGGEENISAEDLARRLDRLGHYCHLAIKEF